MKPHYHYQVWTDNAPRCSITIHCAWTFNTPLVNDTFRTARQTTSYLNTPATIIPMSVLRVYIIVELKNNIFYSWANVSIYRMEPAG